MVPILSKLAFQQFQINLVLSELVLDSLKLNWYYLDEILNLSGLI